MLWRRAVKGRWVRLLPGAHAAPEGSLQLAAPATLQARAQGSGISVPELTEIPRTADGAKQLYDGWAEGYDAALTSWDYPAPRRVAEVLSTLSLPADQRIVDLGCGTGLSGQALEAAGFGRPGGGSVVGTDLSQKSLDIAMSKGCYESVALCSLDEPLPLEDASFGAAISVGVTSYIEQFDVFFREMCRVVRPGGLCVWTHAIHLWDKDSRRCAKTAQALETEGIWAKEYISEPEPYMPNNPEEKERVKKIRLIAFRKAA